MRMTASGINPNKQWRKDNPSRALVIASRKRATRSGIPFNIDFRDVPIPELCPVLGIPILLDWHGNIDNYPTIDRIKPALGYVKGNVAVISYRANRLKSDASLEELDRLRRYMRKHSA